MIEEEPSQAVKLEVAEPEDESIDDNYSEAPSAEEKYESEPEQEK